MLVGCGPVIAYSAYLQILLNGISRGPFAQDVRRPPGMGLSPVPQAWLVDPFGAECDLSQLGSVF